MTAVHWRGACISKMWSPKGLFTFIFLCWFMRTGKSDEVYGGQPKIITRDGHLIFMTADNHNITFKSVGHGSVRINDHDLVAIASSATKSNSEIDRIKDDYIAMRETVNLLQARLDDRNSMDDRFNEIQESIQQLQQQITGGVNGITLADVIRNQTRLKNDLLAQKRRVQQIKQLSEKNECASNPCHNGGTCYDGYNRFRCICPPNWEGNTCNVDVNECAAFIGTTLGCQNGATCLNSAGSYSCQCPPDWYGIHCTERHDDCTSASNYELCAHGTCVNQGRVQQGQVRYTCICDEGWTTDGRQPACDVDVNECLTGRVPCSPLVQCINLPGSFMCAPCPAGYTGDGRTCNDINECLDQNGGCSMSPLVQCTNTPGSRQCGLCPAGYMGDGVTCSYVGICQIQNGGCHPLARCVENTGISSNYRECRCPPGYVGTGYGVSGCVQHGGDGTSLTPLPLNPCDQNPCVRGACVSAGPNNFQCMCPLGFTGQRCELDSDECSSSPCRNGATCVNQANGYACQCAEHYDGLNCENEVDACGTLFFEANGTFRYPSNPSLTYQRSKNCAWILTAQWGKVLKLTFTQFHLEQTPGCEFDFLQLHDGNSAGGHIIGRYCGTSSPGGGQIISTHNSIFMWFHSDSSVEHDGFEVSWETVDPECGGEMEEANHGIITSPGYPGQYPENRDCLWIIKVPLGKRIQIAFATLQLEHHETCDYDYLKIYDGERETDTVLGMYCGTDSFPPAPFQTSGSFALVNFHSDNSHTANGFHLTYVSQPSIPGCGGLLTRESGTFTSPGYPNHYDFHLECDWLIRVPSSERIRLTITSIDIERHAVCRYDFLQVFDGGNEMSPEVGKYCGNRVPPVFTSTGNTIFVRFHSDHSVSHPGFHAAYKIVCGGMFTEPQGVIHSPYYPESYPHSRECVYTIRQESGNAIELTFQHFDIEGRTGDCKYDNLTIRDGDSETSPFIGSYCGVENPDPVESTYNALWLRFITDASVRNRGFLANYTTIPLPCSSGILTNLSGTITYPSSSDEYLISTTCRWMIKVPVGYVIRLTFTAFALESNTNCQNDYVAIYDNTTVENDIIKRYCGNSLPPVITSTDNLLLIVFRSDESIYQRNAFSFHYIAYDASTLCGGNYYNLIGVIRSPNFPSGYPHNKHCTWTIEVPIRKQIMLNFTSFDLESHANCVYDYLEIRNGGYATSPLIGRYCGTEIPRTIYSHGKQMWLKFVSDNSKTHPGFELSWDGTLTGCGGELTASDGFIMSPNYPQSCDKYVSCVWRIKVSRSNKIRLTFLDLDLPAPSGENCNRGVEIYNGENYHSPLLKRVCGSSSIEPLLSDSNVVVLRHKCLINGQDSSLRGFHLKYETVCQLTLNGRRGVIETPNFPDPYPHNRNCSWKIEGPNGNNLSLSFAVLHLERSTDCQYDYVDLYDARSRTSMGRFCATEQLTASRQFLSTSNRVTVSFVSDHSHAENGFLLEWFASGCGGVFSKPSGVISTPNYPQNYPSRITCEWEIIANPGQNIELTIHDYDIEGSRDCLFDSLQIFGGASSTAPRLTKLCHKRTSPSVVTSSGTHMYLSFKSDVNRLGRGFNATYVMKLDGCGGIFNVNKGTIHSRNFPNSYVSGDECAWRITVDRGHTVELKFTDFDIKPAWNCSAVYVAVFDGSDDSSPLLLQHCGSVLPTPNPIITSNNELFIKMIAHESITAQGFKAEYKMSCGATLYADEPGEISIMDQTISTWQPNCTWIIRARYLEDKVTLHFTFLQAVNRAYAYIFRYSPMFDCNNNITIYDGEENDSPVLTTLCAHNDTIPPFMTSSGSALRVVSKSNEYINLDFKAFYREASAGCDGTFESASGIFTSPEYPNSYPVNTECVWTIKSAPGHRMSLSFSVFNLEDSEYCNEDYVEIRENDASGRLMGRFCGQTLPDNLTASHQLWVKFRSNQETVGQGFMASFNLLYGLSVTGTNGLIANPLYPHEYYGIASFDWTITVPIGMFVTVTFLEMDLRVMESYSGCRGSLKFYDGIDSTSELLGSYCGNVLPNPITSHQNTMHIRFTQRRFRVNRGGGLFLFQWNATVDGSVLPPDVTTLNQTSGCGYAINVDYNDEYTLTSPGFPFGYNNLERCQWLVTTPVGTKAFLNLETVDLEGYGCYSDYVEISHGTSIPGEWSDPRRFCNRVDNGATILSGNNKLRIVFTSDISYNGTGFSAKIQPVCGGNVTGPSGSIQTPNYPLNYNNQQRCEWHIIVRPGRTIHIELEDFQLEGTMPLCLSDYVLFYNGLSAESPLLVSGKRCGSSFLNMNNIPETTGNHLYIQFSTNPSITKKGFKLTFTEKSLECGGSILLTPSVPTMRIETPLFPEIYPIQTECKWVILTTSISRIRLDFEDHFDIPFQNDCPNDYLAIYDGGTDHAPLLDKLCGHTLPNTVQASGNVMFVHFSSVEDKQRASGFRATAKLAECGGRLSADYGVVTSPNYPHGYKNGLNCEWIVHGSVGHFLVFTLMDIQTTVPESRNVNCSNLDRLQIRDYNSTGTLLGEFCGEETPTFAVTTADNIAYVRFVSYRDNPLLRGFKLRFNISAEECGGELTTPSGVITSPNFPLLYPKHRDCTWIIRAARDRRVRVTFTHFDLEEKLGSRSKICNDWLAAYNTENETDYSILYPFYMCGSELPPGQVTSGGSVLMLKFYSNADISGRGFRLEYDTDLESECGGDLLAPNGTITSPNFEQGNYSHNHDCRWYLDGSQSNAASFLLRINQLEIENPALVSDNMFCRYDRLDIVSGLEFNSGSVFATMCGTYSEPFVVAVPFPQMIIRFKSDHSIALTGFNITYSVNDCGGLVREEGVITSPGYPSSYGNDVNCGWLIQFEEGQQIQMTSEDFQLEVFNNCSADSVVVHNGMNNVSPVIGRYCGDSQISVRTERHVAFVSFSTNSETVGRGFRIAVAPVSRGCGGVFHSRHGVIKSVDYPNKYPSNVECEWILEGPTGYFYRTNFEGRFDLEMSALCDRDFMEGFDYVGGRWVSLGRKCGRGVQLPFITSSNRLRILFRTNEAIDGDGFTMTWNQICGGIFTSPTKTFSSPNYPLPYPPYVDCIYIVQADPSHYTVLQFDDEFKLEYQENCTFDFVEIYAGNSTDGQLLGKYCNDFPPPITSWLGALTVRFFSDTSVVNTGFKATYKMSECGGIFNHSTQLKSYGRISSPTHPDKYHENMNCTWIIQVHQEKIVQFKFKMMDVEEWFSCRYDHVSLFDGNSTLSPLLGRFCGTALPEIMASTGSFMTVQFQTDHIINKAGFEGVYRSTYGIQHGCGGFFDKSHGTVQSPDVDNDGDYESELDCQFTIFGTMYQMLRLKFVSFDVEPGATPGDCSHDYLEVRDGLTSDAPLIDKFCGSQIPNDITASSNRLWLRFVSDETEEKAGFRATFESIAPACGGLFNVTSVSQTIQSINYPEDYSLNMRCHWILITADYQEREPIEIQFEDFHLEESPGCSKDYLEIREVHLDNDEDIYTALSDSHSKYCGHNNPSNVFPNSRATHIYFVSDSTMNDRGFKLNYQKASCNRTYNLPYGIIERETRQDALQVCIMQLNVPENTTITVAFEIFRVGYYHDSSCDSSYLEIRDGWRDTDPLMAKLCGFNIPRQLRSRGNHLWMKLRTMSMSKIKLLYYSTNQGQECGGTFVASSGAIHSPGFPGNYSVATTCLWSVTLPSNTHASLRVYVNINSGDECLNAYLQIIDGSIEDDSYQLRKFCETTEINTYLLTQKSSFLVKYVTSPQNSGTGFSLHFNFIQNPCKDLNFYAFVWTTLIEIFLNFQLLPILSGGTEMSQTCRDGSSRMEQFDKILFFLINGIV